MNETLWARTILASSESELMRTAAMNDVLARGKAILKKLVSDLGKTGKDLYRLSKVVVKKIFAAVLRTLKEAKGREWMMLALISLQSLVILLMLGSLTAIAAGAQSFGTLDNFIEMLNTLIDKGVDTAAINNVAALLTAMLGLLSLAAVFTSVGLVKFGSALKHGIADVRQAIRNHSTPKDKRLLQHIADGLEDDLS